MSYTLILFIKIFSETELPTYFVPDAVLHGRALHVSQGRISSHLLVVMAVPK